MKPGFHIAAAAAVGAGVYAYYRSLPCVAWAIIGGVLVDLDHVPDFLLEHGIRKISRFYHICTSFEMRKLYLVLHSVELVFIIWAAIAICGLGAIWISMAAGWSVHMLLDILSNPIGMRGYFLFYRMARNFESKDLLIKEKLKGKGKI